MTVKVETSAVGVFSDVIVRAGARGVRTKGIGGKGRSGVGTAGVSRPQLAFRFRLCRKTN